MEEPHSDIVYHYCSTAAFLNIIQNAKLWLSDLKKLNDKKEEVWIREKIEVEIEKRLSEIDVNALDIWKKFLGLFPMTSTVYITCFSESRDLLSQWRSYAQDGQGLCIGFSKRYLEELNEPHFSRFDKVIYKDNAQARFINKIVNENIKKMSFKGVGHTAAEMADDYRLQFPMFKNPSFEEEKEWRLILSSIPTHHHNMHSGSGIFCYLAPKYRTTNNNLISYIEMDFSKIKSSFVKEVWIGPKSKITKDDVLNLLASEKYYDGEYGYSEPILIEHSNSSYI